MRGESAGNITLIMAMAKSINTVPVRLAKEHLGIDTDQGDGGFIRGRIPARGTQDHGARHLGHDA